MFNPLESKATKDFADGLLIVLDRIYAELKRANDIKEYEIKQKEQQMEYEKSLPSMWADV